MNMINIEWQNNSNIQNTQYRGACMIKNPHKNWIERAHESNSPLITLLPTDPSGPESDFVPPTSAGTPTAKHRQLSERQRLCQAALAGTSTTEMPKDLPLTTDELTICRRDYRIAGKCS